ncbi:MAG: methyltransferase domain-containing protein [Coriobacteriia bacterium]|nr:methyltransferase domain-containing protein [Coriobacteriia bacterium]
MEFDIARIAKLDDPLRFETLVPEVMWAALRPTDPETLVEIGAGTGMFAARFASMAPGVTVYAVDTSPEMLAWMREKRPEVASGRVVPVLSEEARVPLPDAVADGVYMINLHHELSDPEAVYGEAFRLAKAGGRVLAVDWLPVETPKGPPLSVRIEPEDLASALRRAGFADALPVPGLDWHGMAAGTKP